MQRTILICLLATALFTISCNDESNHAHDANGNHTQTETHTHDDGSVHQNHDSTAKQEQFDAAKDTTAHQ